MALWIVGLGLSEGQLTQDGARILSSGAQVILRTRRCGAAEWLSGQGIPYQSLDDSYLEAEDFDQLAQRLAEKVAQAPGDVAYGVLDLRDESVRRLVALRPEAILVPGVPVEGALCAWALGPCQTFAASDLDQALVEAGVSALVREIASPMLASEVKVALLERFPGEQTLYIAAGEGPIVKTTLEELDRQPCYDHRTCAFVPAQRSLTSLERLGFYELQRITDRLRGPDGCPWDRAQTHESLRPFVVEEAWEVSDAIEEGDPGALCEELGDLLLQVCLHAAIARQHGEFSMDDVTSGICQKMLRRHPHVFAHARGDDINRIWEEAKRREKGQMSDEDALRGVARGLPALMRAQKVLSKAEKAGRGLKTGERAVSRAQLGRALLEACECARRAGVDAELALKEAVDAFIDDFSHGKPM